MAHLVQGTKNGAVLAGVYGDTNDARVMPESADMERARRKADRGPGLEPGLPEAGENYPAEAENSGFGKFLGWLVGAGARQPDEIRIALAAPLLAQTGSLLVAHGGSTILATVAFIATGSAWAGWCIVANVALWMLRVAQLRQAELLRLRTGAQADLDSLRAYQVIGLAWAALNGGLICVSRYANDHTHLHALAVAFGLGVCSGIVARCARTPAYALGQILCLIVPSIVQNLMMGPWDVLLGLALMLYLGALVSIVRRLYGDLLTLICVQRRSEALANRFEAALANMSHGLVLYDADGTLRVVNRRFFKMFGLAPGTLADGDTPADVARACASAGLLGHATQNFGLHGGAAAGAAGFRVLELADGRSIAMTHEIMPDGGRIATYEDITERRANEARIAHMALHDGLTNMPNRLLFRDRLDQSVARLGRGESFAVACLDLDHFKAVNDTLGHNMGDRLLQEVANRLTCCVREVDLVARLGGDEFAVLLPGVSEASEAEVVARRLIETISGGYVIDGASMVIGVSIGIALAPRDGSTAEALLMHADLAMYAAKSDGRGGARLFESDLSTRLAERQDLDRDFRAALERDEFVMHYQPIVDLASGQVIALEALVRWNHPQRGLVAPDQFIPFAEESELIVQLGAWVMTTACREAARWPDNISVAINLSPVQFRDGKLLDGVLGALKRAELHPSRLEVEITEAAILGETEATLETLQHLRRLGVRVAFDDFGTGFSSLSYLHRFVFDKIKIDKSFIRDLGSSDSASAIVRAITGLGTNLNLRTTAEGVETAAQLAHLRSLGCNEVQGFLFSQPRPAADLDHLLEASFAVVSMREVA